jgi:hypothetical protein
MDSDAKSIIGILLGVALAIVIPIVVMTQLDNRMTLKMSSQGYVWVPSVAGHWEKK